LAIDRRELRGVLGMPPEIPIFDGLPTAGLSRRGELPPGLGYDPAEAVRLLEEAGWLDRDGDGVREHEGHPLALTLLTPTQNQRGSAALYIQDRLRDVGVEVEVQTLELSVALERLYSNDFDALILLTSAGPYSPHDLFGEASLVGYENVEADSLLRRAEETLDPEARDRIYLQLFEIFQADIPATMLYQRVWSTVAHRRVRGLSSPWITDPTRHAAKLWLVEDDE
jgi:peptide/nickel transport system substrate-binding protein